MFKYCPFCGQKLVSAGSTVFKYCPECGGQLANINTEGKSSCPIKKEEKPNMPTAAEKDILKDAKQFFGDLKVRLPSANNHLAGSLQVNSDDAAYYSIILKSCEDKNKLASALKTVLTRSFLAIRMAIDNMPGILVYKGKVEGLAPIVKVLRAQNAGFSVVPGHFNFKTSLACVFPDFNSLFPEVQNLIKAMPLNLWLGDVILGVFPEIYMEALGEENKGVLVVSNQALYFIYQENYAEPQAVVIPFSGIEQLFLEEGRGVDGLIISYKDCRDEDMLVITAELILAEAYEVSRKALKNQQDSCCIKVVCPKCGQTEEHALDDPAQESCVYCHEKYQKTVVTKTVL